MLKLDKELSIIYNNILENINSERNSSDFHRQKTPFDLCINIIEKIGVNSVKKQKWLVIANLEFIFVLKEYFKQEKFDIDDITFATPCDNKADIAQMFGIKNIIKYSYNNDLKDLEMNKKFEFDYIVGNPPYKGDIHMKFLKIAYENLLSGKGQLVFVQPSSYVFSFRKERFSFFNELKKHIVDIIIFNGNVIFENAKFFSPIMITHINKQLISDTIHVSMPLKQSNFNHDQILNVFGSEKCISTLFEKIKNNNGEDYIVNHCCWKRGFSTDTIPNEGFVFWFSGIRGHISSNSTKELFMNDFFTIVQKDKNAHIFEAKDFKKQVKGSGFAYHFNTREEIENFYNFLTTNFARTAVQYIKNDQNLAIDIVPWLNFKEEWTDEKLFDFFQLTNEEIEFVNTIPKYY